MKTQFILIVGNPIEGFMYVGPFEDGDRANEYGQTHLEDAEWWVDRMQVPEDQS